ncbi:MAG: L,D-transpeptidase [Planctomycetes bacterium]|nr:L,D-transpeptidase [Planctomycetota bacterium]
MISRREILKHTAIGLASLAFLPFKHRMPLAQFPQAERLGRVTVGMEEVKAKPDADSATVAKVYDDAVVPWLREVVGRRPFRRNQRWVETPQGYIWAPYLQPVKNIPNTPVKFLPETSLGPGLWAEVTIPYVDLILANPPARSPWLKEDQTPRLYYSQVLWIDQIKQDEQGQTWCRVNERFGYGDLFWAKAEAFRPLSQDEIAPIHPEVADKRVVVNIAYQTLSCFEGKNEVYFALVSTGIREDMYGKPTEWGTPLGVRPIWRKLVSVHMSGGTTGGGYDLPGVSWTSLFDGNGVAIHSTFWHNNFGEEMSHGCVNAAPEDAKWVFRWTNPIVSSDPGDLTVGMPGGTLVEVVEY